MKYIFVYLYELSRLLDNNLIELLIFNMLVLLNPYDLNN